METYGFELRVDARELASDPENVLDALFEAGLDDAIIAWRGPHLLVQVDRESASLAGAIMSSIEQVDSIDGLRVDRVEPVDLVSIGEIARRKGKTKAWASMIVSGKRGPGNFPTPCTLAHLADAMWRWDDVTAWFESGATPDAESADREANMMAAFNALLDLRKLKVEDVDRLEIAPLFQQAQLAAS